MNCFVSKSPFFTTGMSGQAGGEKIYFLLALKKKLLNFKLKPLAQIREDLRNFNLDVWIQKNMHIMHIVF